MQSLHSSKRPNFSVFKYNLRLLESAHRLCMSFPIESPRSNQLSFRMKWTSHMTFSVSPIALTKRCPSGSPLTCEELRSWGLNQRPLINKDQRWVKTETIRPLPKHSAQTHIILLENSYHPLLICIDFSWLWVIAIDLQSLKPMQKNQNFNPSVPVESPFHLTRASFWHPYVINNSEGAWVPTYQVKYNWRS